VDSLLNSPWLQRHDATERSRCIQYWLEALRHGSSSQVKTSTTGNKATERKRSACVDEYADDEFEIEEEIAEEK
jgi:hypothetical protein